MLAHKCIVRNLKDQFQTFPVVVWTVDGNPLKSGRHVTLDNVDYNSKLVVRPVKREDSGQYTITATNPSGKDSVTVNIVVTDKPSPPQDIAVTTLLSNES